MSELTYNFHTSHSDSVVQKLLEEIAADEGFSQYEIEKTHGSMKGDGYMGIITCVKISGKDKAGKDKVINLVVKKATQSDALRKEVPVGLLFGREIYMYDAVFKTFRKIEQEKELPPSTFAAKFYRGLTEDKEETVILENLKDLGYKLYDCKITMNDDHVSLVMREYGRLHALSFALRDQNPETFQKIVGSIDDHFSYGIKHSNFIQNFVKQCEKAREALNLNADREALKVYDEFVESIEPFFEKLPEATDNYSVALHGDCWTNNMMFKYEDQQNEAKPTGVCFLDFQISRVNSPVLDLSYFFYTCSSAEMINNLDHYLRLYYDSFSAYLTKLGSDPQKIFPYQVLQQHWQQYAKYGLIFAILVIHISLTEKDEIIDMENQSESGKRISNAFDYDIRSMEHYKERVRPIILHFMKNNFM